MNKEYTNFLRHNLSWSRLTNVAAAYASFLLSNRLKRPVVWGKPVAVYIEPTNYCNLNCPLCPSGAGLLTRPKGFMDFELYKSIIRQIEKHAFGVCLWNQGEPFLHPQILPMIRYARARRLYTIASTNAALPLDADAIVASGLDTLIVSLDGVTEATYRQYRHGGELKTVLANLQALVQAKKQRGSDTPVIKWQFIVMQHNQHEQEAARTLARNYGVDAIEFKSVQILDKSDAAWLPDDEKYLRYNKDDEKLQLKGGLLNRCLRLWGMPAVNWDGTLAVCCFDKDYTVKTGNLNQHKLQTLWMGSAFTGMRQRVLTRRASMEICRNCGEGVKLTPTHLKVDE